MSYYVRFHINGKANSILLAEWLNDRGLGTSDVEYCHGGWVDKIVENVVPHLKFTNSEDAIVFALARGSLCESEVPTEKRGASGQVSISAGIGNTITSSFSSTAPSPIIEYTKDF